MTIVLNVGHVLTNAHMGFTKKTVKSLLSYIPRDALINVEVARRYVRQKRSSILEIRVETSQLAAAVAGAEIKPVGDVPNGAKCDRFGCGEVKASQYNHVEDNYTKKALSEQVNA